METTRRLSPTSWRLPAALLAGGLVWLAAFLALPGLAEFLTCRVVGLDPASRFGSAAGFFLYNAPKILLLLILVSFLMGLVRSFFSPERTRKLLGGKREGVGNILAATLGIVTPFCSCSAVPLFLGFVESGVPLGVTFSFLISAPMINYWAVVLLFGLFGWQVAALYVGTGLAIAITAGWVIGRLRLERWVEDWVYQVRAGEGGFEGERLPFETRVAFARDEVRKIVGRVWPYVAAGIAVGALIRGYVPEDLMLGLMGKGAWWSVPAAVAAGIPMYAGSATIIPIVQALMEKGAALGTVLAFMMSVIGLSLPEMIILRRVLRIQLIAAFVGVVGAGIVLTGYLFNLVIP